QYVCFLFFFSSRRRHTSSLRDWSSDVCSSDLGALLRLRPVQSTGQGGTHRSQPEQSSVTTVCISLGAPTMASTGQAWMHRVHPRSEERRVGKECRHGRGQHTEKKEVKRDAVSV